MPQSFAKVALTPKWIGALLLALAVAAIFAALGQWQLDRALTTTAKPVHSAKAVPLNQLTQPNDYFKDSFTNRIVTANITSAKTIGIVNGRRQANTKDTGYWSFALATLQDGSHLVIAYDFETTPKTPLNPPTGPITGRYLPSEDPNQAKGNQYTALSVEQAINAIGVNPAPTYAGVVALTEGPGTNIAIAQEKSQTEVNALNAFYAIEWTVFAGFAIFLWWRMVQDERLGLRAER